MAISGELRRRPWLERSGRHPSAGARLSRGARWGRRGRVPRVDACLLGLAAGSSAAADPYVAFESGQVRPLAMSHDGTRLFAVNTPDGRLEIFGLNGAGLVHQSSVPVGLEPVAVAVRDASEVWVVNHASDSVSIVDVALSPPRVIRTLLVGATVPALSSRAIALLAVSLLATASWHGRESAAARGASGRSIAR